MILRRIATAVIARLPIGLREAANHVVLELTFRKRHLAGLRKARNYRGRTGMALHLGCGSEIKEGWVNVDLHPAADLTLDAREPLPFADNSFRIIYSEHFLGCFSYPGVITQLLSECYRELELGGIHAFCVPDGRKLLRHYTTREYPGYDEAHRACHPEWCDTPMDHVLYSLQDGGRYRWYYDEENMGRLLQRVGFVDIRKRPFDPTLDQAFRRIGSMYQECRKPTASATERKERSVAVGAG